MALTSVIKFDTVSLCHPEYNRDYSSQRS